RHRNRHIEGRVQLESDFRHLPRNASGTIGFCPARRPPPGVENLIVIGETAETLTLIGNNTYFYQDGTTQEEERTYILQLIDGEPRIIASNFVRITKRRS
ncbi:MAG: hypothetical protein AAGC93_28755, partial [Cyanobacteria bacterium P01_F01_bin.53]